MRIVNVFCFYCNLSAFVQLSRIRALYNLYGQEGHRLPKSEGARKPMKIIRKKLKENLGNALHKHLYSVLYYGFVI